MTPNFSAPACMHPSAVAALALRPSGACQTYQSPPSHRAQSDLWPQLFSDVSCIALWISSEKILTRLYSVLHWFHKRLEVNVKNPREMRCFQIIIVFSFGSVDNSNKCTVLWKIAARLITVSTSVNNEMWVKLRATGPNTVRHGICATSRVNDATCFSIRCYDL